MHILILEDDSDYAQALAALVKQMGHAVHVAYDCATACELARSHAFDVILSDVELPDGDGRSACEKLRVAGRSQSAYMIAVTGRDDLDNDDFPAFDGYARKPFTYELLKGVLEEWRVAIGLKS